MSDNRDPWSRILDRPFGSHAGNRAHRHDVMDELRGGAICLVVLALLALGVRGCDGRASAPPLGGAPVLAAELHQTGECGWSPATYFDTSDDDFVGIYVYGDGAGGTGWHHREVSYRDNIACWFAEREGWCGWPLGSPDLCVPPIVLLPQSTATPTATAATAPAPGPTNTPAAGGLINVNTATLAQLDTLPHVGPVIAQRIIDARPLKDCADMEARVQGLGPLYMADICPLVTF